MVVVLLRRAMTQPRSSLEVPPGFWALRPLACNSSGWNRKVTYRAQQAWAAAKRDVELGRGTAEPKR